MEIPLKTKDKTTVASTVAQTKKFSCQYWTPKFHPWVRKIPWRREWQPTPVFFPGEIHRQRSLVGYNPWGQRIVAYTSLLH